MINLVPNKVEPAPVRKNGNKVKKKPQQNATLNTTTLLPHLCPTSPAKMATIVPSKVTEPMSPIGDVLCAMAPSVYVRFLQPNGDAITAFLFLPPERHTHALIR